MPHLIRKYTQYGILDAVLLYIYLYVLAPTCWTSSWTANISIINKSWWRHQIETFSALLAICAGNSPVTGEFPAQRPVTRSFDVFFDLRLNKWLSIEAGDLRRYRAHYDVIVMNEWYEIFFSITWCVVAVRTWKTHKHLQCAYQGWSNIIMIF